MSCWCVSFTRSHLDSAVYACTQKVWQYWRAFGCVCVCVWAEQHCGRLWLMVCVRKLESQSWLRDSSFCWEQHYYTHVSLFLFLYLRSLLYPPLFSSSSSNYFCVCFFLLAALCSPPFFLSVNRSTGKLDALFFLLLSRSLVCGTFENDHSFFPLSQITALVFFFPPLLNSFFSYILSYHSICHYFCITFSILPSLFAVMTEQVTLSIVTETFLPTYIPFLFLRLLNCHSFHNNAGSIWIHAAHLF